MYSRGFVLMLFLLLAGGSYAAPGADHDVAQNDSRMLEEIAQLNQASRSGINTAPAASYLQQEEALARLKTLNVSPSDSLYLEVLFSRGLYYARQQLNDSLIDVQTAVYIGARRAGLQKLAARAVSERAIAYEYMGNYQKAFADYYTALGIYEHIGDEKGIMHQYMNIGLIYQYQKKYDAAVGLYNKAISIGERIKDEPGLIGVYNNLAIVYQEKKQYEKALTCFAKVLAFDIRSGDSVNIGGSYNNIGVVYHGMKQPAKALSYFRTSLVYKESQNDHEGIANTSNNIAEVYTDEARTEAEQWLNRSMAISTKYKFNGVLLESYRIARQYYEKKNDYRKALMFATKEQELKDSIADSEAHLEIVQVQKLYELERAAKEIAEKNMELERSKYQEWIYLLLTIVVILAAMYLYFNMQKSRLLNRQLRVQNKQIIDANEELLRKNQEAERARMQAEEAVKAKSQFLSVMSHEIRTPLNAIIGLANLLNENQPRPDQEENLNVLKTSSVNLLALLSDILDFNKIEAGKMEVEQVDFDLKQLVDQLHNLFTGKAAEKGLALRLAYDYRIPARLNGDSLHLNQVLLNLVSNALKFTKEGHVEIRVTLLEVKGDTCTVEFAVTDTGIGIPAHQLHAIFDPFIQADSKTTREFGGTGLGLSISKQLLTMLDASLEVKSQPGKGSEFRFTLHFKRSMNIRPGEPENTNGFPDLSGVKILIAEDNSVNVFVIRQFLTKWNAETSVAPNGEQAIGMSRQTHYDLILMDLHMPVMDGLEASRQIMENKPGMKIIAITATQETEISEDLKRVGIIDFVGKPFKPEELAAKIQKALLR